MKQKLVYVDGSYVGTINDYISSGWDVISANAVATESRTGAYVLIAKRDE